MGHYFTDDPNLKSNVRLLKLAILKREFSFYTDDGIFSKDELDEGTDTLIGVVAKEPIQGHCLDFGCANGIVGIVVKTLFPMTTFDLVDVNHRALDLAKKNVALHQLQGMDVFYSDIFQNNTHLYDCIFLNPPIRAGKEVIYAMYEGAYHHLNQGGKLYVVIKKSHGAPSSKDKLMQLFGNCDIMERNRGFYVLKSTKNQE